MRKEFTDDQIETMLSNPYTLKVSKTVIKFTPEFFERFWILYLENLPIKDIFKKLGYDPDVLGTKRTEGIVYNLRKDKLTQQQRMDSIQRYSTSKRPPSDTNYSDMPTKVAIKTMETELTYLRQEVEFLKKISQLETRKS